MKILDNILHIFSATAIAASLTLSVSAQSFQQASFEKIDVASFKSNKLSKSSKPSPTISAKPLNSKNLNEKAVVDKSQLVCNASKAQAKKVRPQIVDKKIDADPIKFTKNITKSKSSSTINTYATDYSSIEGEYTITIGDYYNGDNSQGSFQQQATITRDGNEIVIECDYFTLPVYAYYYQNSRTITFTKVSYGSFTLSDGQTVYVAFEPFFSDPDAQQFSFIEYSVIYNPNSGVIAFPPGYGFAWKAYADQSYTDFLGSFASFDVEQMVKQGGSEEPAPKPSGWTLLGDGFFTNEVTTVLTGEQTIPYEVKVYKSEANPNIYFVADAWKELFATIGIDHVSPNLQLDVTDPTNVLMPVSSLGIRSQEEGDHYVVNYGYICSVNGEETTDRFTTLVEDDKTITITFDPTSLILITQNSGVKGYINEVANTLVINKTNNQEVPEDPVYSDEGWRSLGTATLIDSWITSSFVHNGNEHYNPSDYPIHAELQQYEKKPTLYRLINPYYDSGWPFSAYNHSTLTGYIVFDIADPDHVIVKAGYPAGYNDEVYEFYITNYLGWQINGFGSEWDDSYLPAVYEFMEENGQTFDTYADGVVTINTSTFSTDKEYSKLYTWTGSPYHESKIIFPDAKSVDYSSIQGKYTIDFGEIYYNVLGLNVPDQARISRDGNALSIHFDGLGLDESLLKDIAQYNESTGEISFRTKNCGAVTMSGQTVYVRFEPTVYNESTGNHDIVNYSVNYDKSTGTIAFPDGYGFQWSAFLNDQYTVRLRSVLGFTVNKMVKYENLKLAAPVISYDGRYVTITAEEGAEILMSLSSTGFFNYTEPHDVGGLKIIEAFATKEGYEPSDHVVYPVMSYGWELYAEIGTGGSLEEAYQWADITRLNRILSNPNFLVYTYDNVTASGLVGKVTNIVLNGNAERIALSEGGMGWYCPYQFVAGHVDYTRNFTKQTAIDGGCAGWETIALPFDVQFISNYDKGHLYPFAANESGIHRFWLYEPTASDWKAATKIEANKPYLIAMPNNPAYSEQFNISGNVTFTSYNVTIPVTPRDLSYDYRDGYKITANYFGGVWEDNWLVVNDETVDGMQPGSCFITQDRYLRPFEAYLTAPGQSRVSIFHPTSLPAEMMAEMTMRVWADTPGSMSIFSPRDASVNVFDVSGRAVRTVTVAAGETVRITDLPSGLYIVEKTKIAIHK